MKAWSRRSLLQFAAAALPLSALNFRSAVAFARLLPDGAPSSLVLDSFPSHPPELVREMVIVAHYDQKRVRDLLEARPSLARAAWDWGFGDWETALGAASHMGNRPIAEYLIGKGARPSLFSATMLGQLDVVKAFIAAQPGTQRIRGPHSISLLAHAKAGGPAARPVFDFLQSLEGAGDDAEAPLSDSDRALVLGSYAFGSAPNQQIDMTMEHNPFLKIDQLTWTRKGTMARPLYHLGEKVFYPAGAAAVRIHFTQDADAVVMTVDDPDLVLTARCRKKL
jgi:hypothetical protein